MTTFLNEYDSRNILKDFGLPTGRYWLARSPEEAESVAGEAGFPVVMKIVSDQIIHKTEAGGIRLNLRDGGAVRDAFREIMENARQYQPDASLEGVLVYHMVPKGIEVIVGGLQDVQFGPVIMFGIGGVMVELYKDVQFRMAPIDKAQAIKLIQSIKAFPLLNGFRGQTPANIDALAEVVVKTSQLLDARRDILEIDLNPIICYEDQVQVLDSSIGLGDSASKPIH